MTEFKKATAATDGMGGYLETVMSEASDAKAKKAAFDAATSVVQEWEARILKMKAKADEPNPDKRVYGEAMSAKVRVLHDRFYEVVAQLEEMEPHVAAAYQPIEEERQQALAAEASAQREREERERRLQAEVQRQLEEERLEARREAEQRERDRVERHRAAVAEAARVQEQLRQQVEDEKRERVILLAYLNRTPTRVLLHKGLRKLFEECKGGVVAKQGIAWLRLFDDTVRSLHQFSKNLAGHPDSSQLKQMRYTNENFARDILARGDGAITVLYSLGYRPAGYAENKFLLLEELDPVKRYAEWEQWWDEVKWTRDYFNDLVESMRDHRRGVAKGEYEVGPHLPPVPEEILQLHTDQLEAPEEEERPELSYFS